MSDILNIPTYSYDDLTIMPTGASPISHREECNPYKTVEGYEVYKFLPLFTAPMDTVVSTKNAPAFIDSRIMPILPRSIELPYRMTFCNSVDGGWSAFSLDEFEKFFCKNSLSVLNNNTKFHVCLDVANGHMTRVLETVKTAKSQLGDKIVIMCGNIGSDTMYEEYAKASVDFVRVGIGSGGGCLTASNTGVHTPQASLVKWCYNRKKILGYGPMIIADGGTRNYSDIIKALALGADFVMCGQLFAQAIESAGSKYFGRGKKKLKFPIHYYWNLRHKGLIWEGDLSDEHIKSISRDKKHYEELMEDRTKVIGNIYSEFYGMASREGQVVLNGEKKWTSEGLRKLVEVKYHIWEWIDNFKDYLRSAMSYVGARDLDEFKEKSVLVPNSVTEVKRINR